MDCGASASASFEQGLVFGRHPFDDDHGRQDPQNTAEHEIKHMCIPGCVCQSRAGNCNGHQCIDNDQQDDEKHADHFLGAQGQGGSHMFDLIRV